MNIAVERIRHKGYKRLKYPELLYPQPNDESLPRMYPLMMAVGCRSAGKTFLISELLKMYQDTGLTDPETGLACCQRIFMISPTVAANPIVDQLKHFDKEKDLFDNYTPRVLDDIIATIEAEAAKTAEYLRRKLMYDRFLKARSLRAFTLQELQLLEEMGYQPPAKPRFDAPCVNFLFVDDMLGSRMFSNSPKNLFVRTCIRNRHLRLGIIIATQGLKSVNKVIRNNASVFMIFKYAAAAELSKAFMEEVSAFVKAPELEALAELAWSRPHGALVVDFSKEPEKLFNVSFKEQLTFTPLPDGAPEAPPQIQEPGEEKAGDDLRTAQEPDLRVPRRKHRKHKEKPAA
jgi:hypothetical protein